MTKREGEEVPGSSVGTAVAEQRRANKLLSSLVTIQANMEELTLADYRITSIRIVDKSDDASDIMMVVKALNETGRIVSFTSASSLYEVVISLSNRMRNGQLKWKVDEYESQ